jgi:hypothetical protein
MTRFIVRTLLMAGLASWLVTAGAGTQSAQQPAAQQHSGDSTIGVCAPTSGTSALDWFCGATPRPVQRPA